MQKTCFLRIIAFLAILPFCFPAFAVSTTKIDAVRSKETLADSDTEVIETFVAEAFKEFLATNDFSDIAAARMVIVNKSTSELESGQFQYGPRYLAAAQKQITQAFEKISKMPNAERKQLLTMNLLILISDLGNLELSKAAFDYLQNPDAAIRYWAVSCLTNTNVLNLLNMAENSRTADEFGQKLLSLAKTEESPDIIILLSQFGGGLKPSVGNEILQQIAQGRINLYLNWQVKDEMVENWLLKALSNRSAIDSQNSTALMRNFATLYSLVIQRYILGQEVLPVKNIRNMAVVISQGEKDFTKYLPDWQNNLKRAIDRGGGALLQTEHDSLLGSASTAGKLPTAAGFDYGPTKTSPPTLPKPPKMEKRTQTKTETEPNQPEETAEEPNQ
ncbi:MAG: hypothetical protein ABSE89_01195 [Sedimentisphaerales bacterium]